MINKSVLIGSYNNLEIYYNRESKIIEASGETNSSLNQSKLLALILVTVSFIKIIDTIMANVGIKARIIVMILSLMIGVFSGYIVNRKIYIQIKLWQMPMSKNQFEDFYLENKNNLKIVKWLMICSILALFIEIYVYISMGIFLAVFLFLINTFIVTLLFLSGVHSREKIFKEIKDSYICYSK